MTPDGALRQHTGLIVEDDSLYAVTLQRSLRKRGFEFVVAASIEEALGIAAARKLDLAVIDLYLRAQSGLDLIGVLREKYPDMRILLLTGHGTFDTEVEAIRRGANHYLLKPATADAILCALLAENTSPLPPVPARP